MSSELMRVPFAYNAEVLPSDRYRSSQNVQLRGEIFVEVAEIYRGEIDEVVDLPTDRDQGRWRAKAAGGTTILARDGRLYAPMLVRGRQVSVDEARDAIKEREVLGKGERPDSPFSISEGRAYPLSLNKALPLFSSPLDLMFLGNRGRYEGWPRPRQLVSDLNDRENEAAGLLHDAFLLVSGVLYLRCSEPVWSVRHVEKRTYRLAIETTPWDDDAENFFRLDRQREALAWAQQRRMRIAEGDIDGPINLMRPEILMRCDALEVARRALNCWPHYRDEYLCSGYRNSDGAEALDAIHMAGPLNDIATASKVMDAWRQLGSQLGDPTDLRFVRSLAARWRGEGLERDLFAAADAGLSAADLAALRGL